VSILLNLNVFVVTLFEGEPEYVYDVKWKEDEEFDVYYLKETGEHCIGYAEIREGWRHSIRVAVDGVVD
jgi:hypothetical protein